MVGTVAVAGDGLKATSSAGVTSSTRRLSRAKALPEADVPAFVTRTCAAAICAGVMRTGAMPV